MRRVLIVSPHFPPADAVDMHRVRMTAGHYRACGWEPVILTARAQDTGRLIDPALTHLAPDGVRVEEVATPHNPFLKLIGLNALGFRAFGAFERAGAALLARESFDLVFISTTSFPLMRLGAVWKAGFGVPFVLDFQDPWATYPESGKVFFRKGPRHAAMRALHRRWEGQTVPAAGGLMAVTQAYIDLLKAAYPAVASVPALVSPFGYSARDFEVAERLGTVAPALTDAARPEVMTVLYAGRVAPSMERSLAAMFALVAAARAAGDVRFAALRFVFIGTGYAAGASEKIATRLAREAGIADQVSESPERISIMDALKTTLAADALLVMGSDDEGYTPSKMSAALSLKKPLFGAGPAASPAAAILAGLDTVLWTGAEASLSPAIVAAAGERLAGLMAGRGGYAARIKAAAAFEAAACAARDCGLFDQVLAART